MPAKPPRRRRSLLKPAGLREAFHHLAGWFEAETWWTPEERRAAALLQDADALDPVWCDLEGHGVVGLHHWCPLLVDVLLKAYAWTANPDKRATEHNQVEDALATAAAVHAAVVELREWLPYVPSEGEPGYQEEQRKVADSLDVWSALEAIERAFPDPSGSTIPALDNSRSVYTHFMDSLGAMWREAQQGEQPHLPDLTPAHMVAFVEVLLPAEVSHVKPDTLMKAARRAVQVHWQ